VFSPSLSFWTTFCFFVVRGEATIPERERERECESKRENFFVCFLVKKGEERKERENRKERRSRGLLKKTKKKQNSLAKKNASRTHKKSTPRHAQRKRENEETRNARFSLPSTTTTKTTTTKTTKTTTVGIFSLLSTQRERDFFKARGVKKRVEERTREREGFLRFLPL